MIIFDTQLLREEGKSDPVGNPSSQPKTLKRELVGIALLLLSSIILRFVFLNADPDWRLDWSTGLFTDESFYCYNARNAILFGLARLDGFNNMVLSPLLHLAQLNIFSLFGVGYVQTRALSSVCGFLASILFSLGIGRLMGRKAGIVAFVLLGLDHAYLLYNRVALMETPATLMLSAAFLTYALSFSKTKFSQTNIFHLLSLFVTGIFLIAAYSIKLSSAVAIPGFLIALFFINDSLKGKIARLSALLIGLISAYAVWNIVWVTPHHAEMTHMLNHYRQYQIQPHTITKLLSNISIALFGTEMGWFSFHSYHQPVLMITGILGITALIRNKELRIQGNGAGILTAVWLICGVALMSVVSYAPTRYYVVHLPALAGLGAFVYVHFDTVWKSVVTSATKAVQIIAALALGLTLYHFVKDSILDYSLGALYAVSIILVFFIIQKYSFKSNANKALMTLTVLFCVFNAVYYTNWLTHRTYQMEETTAWMKENIPANAIIIGDCSPTITLETLNRGVLVMPGLANWEHSIQRFHADYVAIQGADRGDWWDNGYPLVINDAMLIKKFHYGKYAANLYKVTTGATLIDRTEEVWPP